MRCFWEFRLHSTLIPNFNMLRTNISGYTPRKQPHTNHPLAHKTTIPLKPRCANNEILKIFTSWWQQTELTPPPGFSGPNMNRTCHHGDRGRQPVLFKCFGVYISDAKERGNKNWKLLRVQPCWLIDLTSYRTDNQTQWNRRKTHDNKSNYC